MSDDIYQRIVEFTRHHLWEPKGGILPETRLVEDIGIVGEDGKEFIEEYSKEFSVDMSEFDWVEHFGSDGVGCLILIPFCYLIKFFNRKRRISRPITIQDLANWACSGRWEDNSEHIIQ